MRQPEINRFRRAALIGCAVLIVTAVLWPATAEAEDPPGQTVFLAQKCNLCHAVPAAGIEAKTESDKMRGKDLGGKVEGEFADIAAFVRKEGERDGKDHKKPFKGTDEELQAILDWLGSLEAPK
jgi:Cytochrome c